jgi:hypothetical protein
VGEGVSAIEIAAAVKRELGILIIASPIELPRGYLIREFYRDDRGDRVRQPMRIVRPATPDEVERQRRFIAELVGLVGLQVTPGGLDLQYVVESD